MSELVLRNRQRTRRINTPLLRRIVESLLMEALALKSYELCIHLVGDLEMVRLNEGYLRHAGSTDVITFDHTTIQVALPDNPQARKSPPQLQGEIFICLEEATRQARRFGTSWQSELARYVIHGVLHLQGHDDQRLAARRKMKREEDRLLRLLTCRFGLSALNRKTKLRA